MRAIRCVMAGLLAAAIVTAVAAQPGGGFGLGGFGGGDLTTLVVTNTALQDELKVTEAQKTKLKPAADKQSDLMKSMKDAFSGGKFDKDAFTEMREKGQKVNDEVKKIVEDTLTADQKKRLKQISVQQMQFNVFNDPDAKAEGKGGKGGGFRMPVSEAQKAIMKEVGDAMKLTDKQKGAIKGVVDEFNKDSRELFAELGGGGKGGFGKIDPDKLEGVNKKIDRLRKEAWEKVDEQLTSAQRTAWKGMVGEPFDLAKLRPVMPKKD
jgi:Spy/CpxP family protein refolding chaperone